MSTIEQTLNAGVPVTFPGGQQFHLLEADDPVDVTFYDNRNRPIETWAAMKGGFRIVFEKGFIQVKLESATGQTVKLALTGGRGEYDRSQGDVSITSGVITTVQSITAGIITEVQKLTKDDSRVYHTLEQKAYFGGAYRANLAANISMVQLWNPAASGYKLHVGVFKAMIEDAGANNLRITRYSTTLTDNAPEGNKYLGGANGVASVKMQAGGALLGTELVSIRTNGADYIPLPFKQDIIVPEGSGLLVGGGGVDKGVGAYYEWIEVAV